MTSAWRPPGWASDPALPIPAVAELAAVARGKKRRGETLTLADQAALADEALLRQSYATPRWVWRLAGWLLGVKPGEWAGDPYYNAWAHSREFLAPGAWVMDGTADDPENDGFVTWHDLIEAAGAPECDVGDGVEPEDPAWPGDGPVLCNGPHRKGSQGTSGWLRLAARAGRRRKVAAVVQADVVSWYLDHALECDAEVQLGRMEYDPPPGLTTLSGNERCSALLLWDPAVREGGQEIQPAMLEVPDDRGRIRRCPLRSGLRGAPVVRVEHKPVTPRRAPGPGGCSACGRMSDWSDDLGRCRDCASPDEGRSGSSA